MLLGWRAYRLGGLEVELCQCSILFEFFNKASVFDVGSPYAKSSQSGMPNSHCISLGFSPVPPLFAVPCRLLDSTCRTAHGHYMACAC